MSTTRLTILFSMFAALVWPGQLLAHGGEDHRVLGTVTAVHADHLEVENKNGEKVSIVLNGKTKYSRGKTAASAAEVKVGQRVVVSVVEGPDGKMIAHEISIATTASPSKAPGTSPGSGASTSAQYTCEMHPDVVKNKPGECPKCGMTLKPKR